VSSLLEVKNLKTYFNVGIDKVACAVDGISFKIEQGKTLAIVGESGCGKTQTAFSIIRLIANNGFHPSGQVYFNKKNLSNLTELEMQSIRGNDISMIFQEPMTSLNPLYRIGNQLEEPLYQHRKIAKGPARKLAIALLNQVGIPDPHKRVDYFPHELSGGMKQRVMIAMALACKPKLLIADEPTTALDVTIQAQVLKLMSDLQKETGMSILLITHDMGIVNQIADDICIMYAGRIAERGPRDSIFKKLKAFKPEFILLSAGFDAHKDDPLAQINLESKDYYTLTKRILSLAKELCDGKVVSILEGGYDLNALKESVDYHVKSLIE